MRRQLLFLSLNLKSPFISCFSYCIKWRQAKCSKILLFCAKWKLLISISFIKIKANTIIIINNGLVLFEMIAYLFLSRRAECLPANGLAGSAKMFYRKASSSFLSMTFKEKDFFNGLAIESGSHFNALVISSFSSLLVIIYEY